MSMYSGSTGVLFGLYRYMLLIRKEVGEASANKKITEVSLTLMKVIYASVIHINQMRV